MARFDSEAPHDERYDPDSGLPLPPVEENPELADALAAWHDARAELDELHSAPPEQ